MALRAGTVFHGTVGQPSAQVIDGSLKFEASETQYLNRTFSAGNRKTWTWSGWIKKSSFGTSKRGLFGYDSTNDHIRLQNNDDYGDSIRVIAPSVFDYILRRKDRDTGWFHLVVACDTTDGTAGDRVKIYHNGVRQTDFYSSSNPSSNADTGFNQAAAHSLGRGGTGGDTSYVDASLSNVYWIDGQALGPENFGFTDPLTNTWRPKKYTGDFNVGSADYSGVFAPYSATNRFSSFGTTGTVTEDATGYTLPMSNPSHYGGKALEGSTGGFYVDTVNSATEDFFMGCWIKIDTLVAGDQMGVDLGGNYKYFEIRSNGVIGIRHNGGGRQDSSNTNIGDGNWHHIALSRSGNTMYAYLDGVSKVTTTAGVSGNTITENETFNFFGTSFGGGYDIDGHMIDAFVYIGQGVSSNFSVPTAPLIDSSGNINHYSGFSDSQLYYASPLVTVSGSTPNTLTDYIKYGENSFYLPMDGNSPIGQDKSGNGNDWTPVRFGNTNKIDSPNLTGGTPILNTNEAGTVALPGYKTDSNASNLVVALPLVGAEGGTSFNDIAYQIKGSGSSKSFTAFTGNSDGGGKTSIRGSVLYGSSFYTTRGATNSNAGDYIERTGDSDLSMGTGDYTIEFWFHPYNMETNDVLIDTRHPTTDWPNDDNGIMIYINANGDTAMVSNGVKISGSGVVGKNQDNHFALTREGTTERLFVNGNLIGTATNRTNDYNRDRLHLGSSAPNGEGSSGYYNDLRVYKGVAKYTSPFKVGSPNPTVLPDTPSGVSGGSKLAKITEGAVSFEGTATSKLTLADSTDFTFGTNDFCIEFYYYNQSLDGTYNIIFDCMGSNRSGIQLAFETDGDYRIEVGDGSSNWIWQSTGFDAKANKWTHFALTRQSNTFRAFEDGVLLGTQTSSTAVGDPRSPAIGGYASDNSTNYGFNGFISNFRIVNGSAVYTSAFTPSTAPLTNVTNTKLLCCQSNSSTINYAVSPGAITATNAAATNFNPFNTSINTVRGQETGYPTFNPLIVPSGGDSQGSGGSLSDGNLTIKSGGSTGNYHLASCSPSIPLTGKYYFEFTTISAINTDNNTIGIFNPESPVYASGDYARINPSFSGSFTTTKKRSGTATNLAASAGDFSGGDVVNIAIDSDNRSIWFGRNGVYYEGNPSTGTGASYTNLTAGVEYVVRSFVYTSGGAEAEGRINFGQKPFKFPPPDGFQPLNAANVRPETVIARPDQYVEVTTYTGDGNSSGRHINIGFRPDLIWLKSRGSGNHGLYDSVRGADKRLQSDSAGQQDTVVFPGASNFGFDFGSETYYNASSTNYVAWTWKAGGAPTATNTQSSGAMTANSVSVDGVLQSAYTPSGSPTIYPKKMSVGTKQGFSIVQYEGNNTAGATLPHGLTKAPDVFITKASNYNNREWQMYHKSLGNQQPIRLNTNQAAQAAHVSYFNNTSPTANVVTFGVGGDANQGGETTLTYVMYAWHDVPGLQKFGSYTGNGDTGDNGPFIELGFRPAIIWFKRTEDDGYNWNCYDTTRSNTGNPTNEVIRLNLNNQEETNYGNGDIDVLANGFKIRNYWANVNADGKSYIYCAWAEQPAFNLYGGQSNAR